MLKLFSLISLISLIFSENALAAKWVIRERTQDHLKYKNIFSDTHYQTLKILKDLTGVLRVEIFAHGQRKPIASYDPMATHIFPSIESLEPLLRTARIYEPSIPDFREEAFRLLTNV